MNVIILQPALDDFLAVGAYFDGVSERLAARFRRCVEKTIEAILDFPKLSAAIRRVTDSVRLYAFENTASFIGYSKELSSSMGSATWGEVHSFGEHAFDDFGALI
jgi:hypothetical protein